MKLAEQLETSLRGLLADAAGEVRENGGRLAPFTGLSWEVRGSAEKPLLHLWSQQCNVTRRVLGITEQAEGRLELVVERFGRGKADRLDFIRREFQRPAQTESREEFCHQLTRILCEQFPDEIVEPMSIAPDLQRSLSGNFARGISRRGSTQWAVLGVPWESGSGSVENSLTFALLWLDRARQMNRRGALAGVRLILPKDQWQTIAYRCQALNSSVAVEIYELDAVCEKIKRIDLAAAVNLAARIVPQHERQSLLDAASGSLQPIAAMAPKAIRMHAAFPGRTVWLRFYGLAFARWEDGEIFFGLKEPRKKLRPESQEAFGKLVSQLQTYRCPQASDTTHPLYRAQPERWLESILREDVTRIDARLDARFAYGQVFTRSGEQHGILDVLSVTRDGRLAILELKTSEYIHLPLQAADYWLRIRQHLKDGEFSSNAYFAQTELQRNAPLVYLVAPALRFHSTTDFLCGSLSGEMEIQRIGLTENWRCGIRVMMRQ